MRQCVLSRPLMLTLGFGLAFALTAPAMAQTRSQQQSSSPGQNLSAIRPALDLKARDINVDRAAVSPKSLAIETLDVDVKIIGDLAETTLTARFKNPNSSVLEGEFILDLPREAYVTGFALDVNGVMVDGVLQPKAKAAEAYEENVRRGVDPGLGEINEANQFRTRIFPINPRSARTIKITYVSVVSGSGAYTLPLTTAEAVSQVRLAVSTDAGALARLRLPRGLTRVAPTANNTQTGDVYSGQNVRLLGNLEVANLAPRQDVRMSAARNGEQYFSLIVPAAPVEASTPKIVKVYWDASRSRRDDDLAKEIALLQRYLGDVRAQRVDLVLFSDATPSVTSFERTQFGALAEALRNVRYQGASRFGDLERVGPSDADVCLIFSDGQVSMSAFSVRTWPCKVMSVSTATTARRDILEGLASANRGSFVDLKSLSIEDAMRALTTRGPDVRALQTTSGDDVPISVSPTLNGQFRVTGPRPDGDQLVLTSYRGERRINLSNVPVSAHSGAAAIWGVSQIKRLSATDNPNTDDLLVAVRRFGVATPDYSFIVLETVEDYARNNIAPSASIGKDFLTQYQARRAQIEAAEAAQKQARFDTILTQWNEQKTWWKTRFAPVQPRNNNQNAAGVASDAAADVPLPPVVSQVARPSPPRVPSAPRVMSEPRMVPPPPPPPPPPAPLSESQRRAAQDGPQTVTVTGTRRVARERDVRAEPAPPETTSTTQRQGSAISVSSAPWKPARPYLAALSGVKAGETGNFERIYAEQERQFGNTPAFYFDMAEWAFRNGFGTRAAALARNALELNSTSVDTKVILASRLTRYGAHDQAVWLNERILQATPNKPQALRNLALSIIDGADAGRMAGTMARADFTQAYERALALLMKIVLTPASGDYDGIELIALMEANHLAAKMKDLGIEDARIASQLDQRLRSLLSVDIRVTLEWNTDKTDMDLWVDEPTGEQAIYSNPRTAIGGRLSNDMTRGYGPEEYLLTIAPNGSYTVFANTFAADRLDPNGPTSVTVKLFRDWGKPTEKVESFVVELNRAQSSTVEVGRFTKAPRQ